MLTEIQTENLIKKAKEILWNNSFDEIHDIFHHYRVWENAIEIVYKEKLECDMNLLEVAIWWHDISKTTIKNDKDDDFSELDIALTKENVPESLQTKLKKIITEHETVGVQSSIASKILFDADKIEYVSTPRILVAKRAFSDEIRIKYEQSKLGENLKVRYEELHFEYSKKVFTERFRNLQIFGKNLFLDPTVIDVKLQ